MKRNRKRAGTWLVWRTAPGQGPEPRTLAVFGFQVTPGVPWAPRPELAMRLQQAHPEIVPAAPSDFPAGPPRDLRPADEVRAEFRAWLQAQEEPRPAAAATPEPAAPKKRKVK